jgi:iron complex transport system ATP-binding protein
MSELIRLEEVGLQRGRKTILHGVCGSLTAGELIAVLGPNGAGKSSLFRTIAGDWLPCQGHIWLHGKPTQSFPPNERARRMAVMTQSAHLSFEFTVAELVGLGLLPHPQLRTAERERLIEQALALADLQGLKSQTWTTLSGGERQRVQFARTWIQCAGQPEGFIWLLDEPTSALDLAQQARLLVHAQHHARTGGGVIAILHDLNLALAFADRVWVMVNGRCIEQGNAQNVLSPALVRAVWNLDATRVDVNGRAHLCMGHPVVNPS